MEYVINENQVKQYILWAFEDYGRDEHREHSTKLQIYVLQIYVLQIEFSVGVGAVQSSFHVVKYTQKDR